MASNVQTVKVVNIGFFQGTGLAVRIAAINLVLQAEQYLNNQINLFHYGTGQYG